MSIEHKVRSLSCSSSIEIPDEKIVMWLESIANTCPEVSTFSSDKEKHFYSLKNDESDIKRQIVTRVQSLNQAIVAFGSAFDLKQREDYINKFFGDFSKITNVTPFKLTLIESMEIFSLEYEGNHYDMIKNVFFRESPVSNLFLKGDMRLLQNDLGFRGDIDDRRIAIVEITGGTADEEVRKQSFKKREFKVKISIGLTKQLAKGNKKIAEILAEQDKICTMYVEDEIKKYVINPIEEFLNNQ